MAGLLSKVGLHAPYVIQEQFPVNGGIASCAFPIDDYLEIVEAREVHSTKGTDGSAVTLTIEKLTGTQAPAGGANMLKTSTFDMKGANNTVQTIKRSQLSALSAAQDAATRLAPGDRLCLTFTGAVTSLAGVGVTVVLKRLRQGISSQR